MSAEEKVKVSLRLFVYTNASRLWLVVNALDMFCLVLIVVTENISFFAFSWNYEN